VGIEDDTERAFRVFFKGDGLRDEVAEAFVGVQVGGRVVEVDGLDGYVGREVVVAESGDDEVVVLSCWGLGALRFCQINDNWGRFDMWTYACGDLDTRFSAFERLGRLHGRVDFDVDISCLLHCFLQCSDQLLDTLFERERAGFGHLVRKIFSNIKLLIHRHRRFNLMWVFEDQCSLTRPLFSLHPGEAPKRSAVPSFELPGRGQKRPCTQFPDVTCIYAVEDGRNNVIR
jgi:hypothetical protein